MDNERRQTGERRVNEADTGVVDRITFLQTQQSIPIYKLAPLDGFDPREGLWHKNRRKTDRREQVSTVTGMGQILGAMYPSDTPEYAPVPPAPGRPITNVDADGNAGIPSIPADLPGYPLRYNPSPSNPAIPAPPPDKVGSAGYGLPERLDAPTVPTPPR